MCCPLRLSRRLAKRNLEHCDDPSGHHCLQSPHDVDVCTVFFFSPLDLAASLRAHVDDVLGPMDVELDGFVADRLHVSNICIPLLAFGGCISRTFPVFSAWHCVRPAFRCHWGILAALEAGTCAGSRAWNTFSPSLFFPCDLLASLSYISVACISHNFFLWTLISRCRA